MKITNKSLSKLKDFCKICAESFKSNPKNWKPDYNDPSASDETKNWIVFDYPNYAELPKKVSRKLTGDFVDAMQDFCNSVENNNLKFTSKNLYKHLRDFQKSGYDFGEFGSNEG